MEEEEDIEIGLSIQSSDESDNIEQTPQIITTNDGEYFINTIEITEEELNEQIQLGNVDGNHLLHRENQDYQIQLIGTGSDLSQYKIDSVVNLNSNTTTATSTNTTTTNDIQDYTSEGNYQEVIIINAEDLDIESPTHHHLGPSSSPSSPSLQDFEHDTDDTLTTTIKTETNNNSNIINHHNKSKNKFLLPNPNFSSSTHQHSTNFILTTLEGKLIQFPSTVSNSIPFPITSSGNLISNLTTGQQYIIPTTDLHNTQNFQLVSIPPIQLQQSQQQQQQIINPINQLSKHNLTSYSIQQQPQRNKTYDNSNHHHVGIFKEEVLNDEDLNIKIKSKSVLCYPGAKTNKLNKNNLNIEKETKYQEIISIATSTTNNKTCSTTTNSPTSSNVGEKMLRDVNDNNQTLSLETDEENNNNEINNYQIEGEDEEEEEATTISRINQSTKNIKNIVISAVDNTSKATKATTITPTTASSSASFVTSRMTENIINNTANTVSVNIAGVVCQLQRFMYTQGLCRVCLLVKPDVVSIFEDVNIKSNGQIENSRGPHSAHRYNIIPAIKTLLDIEVNYGDGLPDQICSECIDNLMSFSVFRKKISIGHSKLNAIFAQVKGTSSPTLIPELGERDMKKTDVYRHVDAIIKARELLNNSVYKHMVSRRISDRVLEKIFQALSVVVGFKSGKFKDLEHYVLNEPYVTSWFCYPCNRSIHGPKEVFAQHNMDVHHVKSASDVLYPCDLCNQSFSLVDSTGQNYGEHWLQHLFFYECTECNKKMAGQKGLWAHKRSAHVILNKIFQCDHKNCDKTFSKKAHLDAHKKTHLNPEDRKRFLNWCKICGKGLTSSLAAHMSGVHSENRPYKCDICSKQFKRKEILVGHRENVHLNLKKFACEHKGCTKRFHTAQSLKAHVDKHQDTIINFLSCPICNKQIRMKSNYLKHLKIHQREELVNKETDQLTI